MALALCSSISAAAGRASTQGRSSGLATLADTAACRPAAAAAAALPRRQRQAWLRHVTVARTTTTARQLVCRSYRSNPQNVDNPQVLPSPDFSPEKAVRVQLEALQHNDTPWAHHGIQTAYEFANDVGGLDPSMYFGFPKDLYHYDHFLGMFGTRLPELVNLNSFSIVGSRLVPESSAGPETAIVGVEVQHAQQPAATFEFHLRRKLVGPRKGAWTTWKLLREGQQH